MPKTTAKRKKGGQPRNQNARKHGFYSKILDEAERLELEQAQDLEGLDAEIAVLRVKIQSLLEKDPDNVKLLLVATGTLARLLRTKYSLDKTQGKGLKDAISAVIKDLAGPIIGAGIKGAMQ